MSGGDVSGGGVVGTVLVLDLPLQGQCLHKSEQLSVESIITYSLGG